jgi:hypothetical protein
MSEFPRRIRIDRFTVGEKAIHDAVEAVETMGADERLTRAVILLGQAKEAVADFVDGIQRPAAAACVWRPLEDDYPDSSDWEAGCRFVWSFGDGGPAENGLRFCPNCGETVHAIYPGVSHDGKQAN